MRKAIAKPAPSTKPAKEKAKKAVEVGVKANKGMILRKSVDYIRYLQQLVGAQAARNRALERKLKRNGLSPSFADQGDELLLADEHPLSELEIGMGMGISFEGAFMAGAEGEGKVGLHALEPMPMDEDMYMDMDFDRAVMVNGFGHDEQSRTKAYALNNGAESSSQDGRETHGEV